MKSMNKNEHVNNAAILSIPYVKSGLKAGVSFYHKLIKGNESCNVFYKILYKTSRNQFVLKTTCNLRG